MSVPRLMVAVLGVLVLATTSALAQDNGSPDHPLTGSAIPVAHRALDAPGLPDLAIRRDELRKWIDDYSEWNEWAQRWTNRRQPGVFTGSRERRRRPDPPDWLFGYCESGIDGSDEGEQACALVTEWNAPNAVAQAATTRAAATQASEDSDNTTWWEHVHLDGGWPAMQANLTIYGVIGVHATTYVKGRFEIFIAPGAMLVRVPNRGGGHAWKVATNYGITYRLAGLTLPGGRRALLHVNLAKAWLFAMGDLPTDSTDFIGLSMTFKKKS
jgi:hypothetical protein